MSMDFDPFAGPAFEKSAPSTESQREVFAATQWGPEASCAYNESASLILKGDLNVSALGQALAQLTDRHDALRMFFSQDGQTLFVRPQGTVPEIEQVDLSAVSDRDARLAALIALHVETPFDLENGPLFKCSLVKTGSDTHQLVMTGHHIVVDGWSWGVILRELGPLYSAALHGTEAALESAPSFVDYAVRERAEESTESYAQAQRYWLSQFAGASLPELDLPTDHRRPAFKTYASRRIDFPIPRSLSDRLKTAGAKLGASYFVTMLAGFTATLHRLTRQDDLVVGIPVAGQAATGEQNLVGHGVNLLPLRIGVPEGMTFAELVKSVRKVVLDGSEHQQLSFGGLLKQLAVKRDPSRLPLASVIFNIDQASGGNDLGFAGLDVRYLTNPRHFENFELFVNATETQGETVVEVQYNTDLFEATTIERWLANLCALLDRAASAPETRLVSLDLLSAEEAGWIDSWNRTQAPFDRQALVHTLFEAQVDRVPDAVALEFGAQTVSYRALDEQSNRIARALRAAGVSRGTLVGLCVERSVDMVAAFWGVLKAGGAYVPLDPAFPKDRLNYMIEDAKMPVLLVSQDLAQMLDPRGAKLVTIDSAKTQDGSRITEKTTDAEQAAYVIYTSGSTGKPKGVCVPHRAISNFISSMHRQPGITADDVVVAVTTLSFDIAVLELHASLCAGACVHVASKDEAQDAAALMRMTEAATLMQATPSKWRMLLSAGWLGRPQASASLPAFKALVGGEALPKDLADKLLERTGELWNMYGPTETTVWSTCQRVLPNQAIRIGQPIANTTIEILGVDLMRQPVGVAGELHIGGEGVTLGYLDRADLTAERFIADPFRPGQKLYKTGDLARWMADGTLDYIGRNDHQVKVRGFRIELGEIEAALGSHTAVASNVVLVREDTVGDARIVAYVVPHVGEEYTDSELRKHLRKSLPDYMIPQHFVELSQLPLTPNGKVDRKALPVPTGITSGRRALVAPRTSAERMLAQLFEESLKVSDVSVHDNFFDLGGHSLLCFRVIARVQEMTGVRLNPRIMLMNSLEQTAAMLAQEQEPSVVRSQPEDAKVVSSAASPEADGFAQKMLRKFGLH